MRSLTLRTSAIARHSLVASGSTSNKLNLEPLVDNINIIQYSMNRKTGLVGAGWVIAIAGNRGSVILAAAGDRGNVKKYNNPYCKHNNPYMYRTDTVPYRTVPKEL